MITIAFSIELVLVLCLTLELCTAVHLDQVSLVIEILISMRLNMVK